MDNIVGRNMVKIRAEKKMSQQALADAVGTSRPQIAKYELGLQDMTVSRLLQIAEVLEVEPARLLK